MLPTPDLIGTPIDNAHWMAILKSCSGYEPFHKQRTGFEHGTQVADFLIFEMIFPRSIRFCLIECREACRRIHRMGDDRNEFERQLDDMIDWLNLVDEAVTLGDRIVLMTAHPGRIKTVVEVPFPRPRDVLALRKDPAYGALVFHIWGELRDEVDQARRQETEAGG